MLNISKNTSNTDKSFNRIINVGDFGIYHLNIKWLEYFIKSVTVEGSLFNIVLHFILIFNFHSVAPLEVCWGCVSFRIKILKIQKKEYHHNSKQCKSDEM